MPAKSQGFEARGSRLGQVEGVCEVHMDFAFLGRGKNVQNGHERDCSSEDDGHKTARSRLPARDMVVKSDQESALRSIVEDVGRLKVTDGGGRYVIECSPGASQSNDMMEGAIQSVFGQVRVLLSAEMVGKQKFENVIPEEQSMPCHDLRKLCTAHDELLQCHRLRDTFSLREALNPASSISGAQLAFGSNSSRRHPLRWGLWMRS